MARATLARVPCTVLGRHHRAATVDSHDPVDLVRIKVWNRNGGSQHAGVAEHDVGAAVGGGGVFYGGLDLLLVRHVAMAVASFVGAYRRRDFVAQLVLDVGYDQGCAVGREETGRGLADAAGTAGDDLPPCLLAWKGQRYITLAATL